MSTSMYARSANSYLDPDRIRVARMRRGMTKVDLARKLSVTPRTITKYEDGGAPTAGADALAQALGFPVKYFFRGNTPSLGVDEVRFRAARRATARERDAAVAAGVSGVEIDGWISARFVLPDIDVVPFAGEAPRVAAHLLRGIWGLGTKPLPNLVQLCESRGIRVYTLPAFADAVDAYSIWRGGVPYVFLARRKTPERIRFDLAHELGHLILHSDEGEGTAAQEREADAFASEFLIPGASVVEYMRRNPSVDEILDVRSAFKISAMALAFAAHKAGRMSDWAYRQACIELSQRGFRKSEPGGMAQYEVSRVFPQVLNESRFGGARAIANGLDLPVEDVHALTFGVELRAAQPTEAVQGTDRRPQTRRLRVV
ncbi:ImmA/IrrE family metallo-endopeptidase [Rhodococcus triatomae]|uniref:Zn-dependent peptidase ImmA, M78 family n=3 Tax=Rhodococcus triatomae TaxID=300028 RepID=A0A1G8I7P7_9NOCA|nr:XRE family transcriptional regulator [Rhodococcus triatomae]QNG20971.1 ImmA/IrrE family metallo-endopeptidase [Rhodococcus triatomae]QNG23114.1 ImmA/IrrE family metallo-endopeptidase [Rhodococcus triatomae]SDI14610.1 Zn-dependent peptidase ImmA, M78 family [Rhodococcus triatomae]